MFILLGAKTVKTPVKNGLGLRRRCGSCQYLSDLREHSLRQYFTLFFIPIFPISKAESLLVCDRCGASSYIQPEDYLGSEREGSFHTAGSIEKESVPNAERLVIVCDHCEGRLRIPLTDRKLLVTCPHCKRQFEV